jgi:hypothetical protein
MQQQYNQLSRLACHSVRGGSSTMCLSISPSTANCNLAAVLEEHVIGVEEGDLPVVERASDYIAFWRV